MRMRRSHDWGCDMMILLWCVGILQAETGIGMGLGFPTGVSFKSYLDPYHKDKGRHAFQCSAGGKLGVWGNAGLSCDILRQGPSRGDEENNYTTWFHWGGGVQFEYQSPIQIPAPLIETGVRVVLGGGVFFPQEKIEIYTEIAPTMIVFQHLTWVAQAQVGIRIFGE